MIRHVVYTILAFILGTSPAIAANDGSVDVARTQQERIVYSLASIPLGKISLEKDSPWALLEVTPDVVSGDLTDGAYFDVQANKLVKPIHPHLVARISGGYRIAHEFGAKITPSDGRYLWDVSPFIASEQDEKNALEETAFMAASGDQIPSRNIVICIVNNHLKQMDPFENSYIVPADQVSNVINAISFIRTHLSLFSDKVDAQHDAVADKQLVALASDPNPYISVCSFRQLETHQALDKSTVAEVLAKSSTMEIASFVYLINSSSSFKKDDVTGSLNAAIATSDSHKLVGFYLGASTAFDDNPFQQPRDEQIVLYTSLIQSVEHRFAMIDTGTPDDQLLRSYLSSANTSSTDH